MLEKHKRFALRSVAVGVVASGIVASIYTVFVRQADTRVVTLEHTEGEALAKLPKDFVPNQPSGHWVDAQGKPIAFDATVEKAEDDASETRDNRIFYSILTFIAFALPLIWYFLLDRLREISDAVSGRSKSN